MDRISPTFQERARSSPPGLVARGARWLSVLLVVLGGACAEDALERPLTVELLFDQGDDAAVLARIDSDLDRMEREGMPPDLLDEVRHVKALSLALSGDADAALELVWAGAAGRHARNAPGAAMEFALELAELEAFDAARAVLDTMQDAWPGREQFVAGLRESVDGRERAVLNLKPIRFEITGCTGYGSR